MKEVCHDVRVEPLLQKFTGEINVEKTANNNDAARCPISARGFWISGQMAFFDVRGFNSKADTKTKTFTDVMN